MGTAFTPPIPLHSVPQCLHPFRTPPRSRSRPVAPRAPNMLFNLWKSKDTQDSGKLGLDIGYAYLAHPEKNTGEDAFFVEGNSVGVFDGVSGAFDTRGVDPRLYSQMLAVCTRDLVKELGDANVVKAAMQAADENDEIGASTACVVGMQGSGRLFGINLGDSGVRIVRGGKMLFRTREQQHFFNCPYQLGTDSEDGLAMGQNVQQKLREGDWLIVATDGLYDNITDDEIVQMARENISPMDLADKLGDVACAHSLDKTYVSPFMMAAISAGEQWQGGKTDDITIVTARVSGRAVVQPTSLLSTLPEVADIE